MKSFLTIFLFFVSICPLFAEPVVVFEKMAPDARWGIIDRMQLEECDGKERLILPQHPLVYIHEYRKVTLPDGSPGFVREDIMPSSDGKSFVRETRFPVAEILGIIICAVLLGGILYRNFNGGAADREWLLVPVLLRILLLLISFSKWDCVFSAAVDEYGYFETISDMLKGNWSNQWRFTIGTGLFYLPFVLITGAKDIYDIVPYFNWFSALVLAPGVLILGGLILRKLGVTAKRAAAAMAVWAVLPFVLFHMEVWEVQEFQHFFLFHRFFTDFERLIYYAFCINSGFNAMSDMPGLLVMTGCGYFALAMPDKKRYALLFGMLYGFGCLIRINYILLSPLFAFLLYCKFKGSRQKLLAAAGVSVAGFLLVFSIQLVCNFIQFGSPFTFGYVLHYPEYAPLDRPAAGFTWHTFAKLTFLRYLIRVNLPVFALGAAALWVMKNRFNQAVLVLWSVPLILFFCGYSHTFCDGRRFVFPAAAALLMAVAVTEVWQDLRNWRERLPVAGGLLLMVMFALPFRAKWRGLPFFIGDNLWLRGVQTLVPVILFVVVFQLLKKRKLQSAGFVILAQIFYYSPPEVLGAGLFLLLPWIFCGGSLKEKISRKICDWSTEIINKPGD